MMFFIVAAICLVGGGDCVGIFGRIIQKMDRFIQKIIKERHKEMTVKELIETLSKLENQDARIELEVYECSNTFSVPIESIAQTEDNCYVLQLS